MDHYSSKREKVGFDGRLAFAMQFMMEFASKYLFTVISPFIIKSVIKPEMMVIIIC